MPQTHAFRTGLDATAGGYEPLRHRPIPSVSDGREQDAHLIAQLQAETAQLRDSQFELQRVNSELASLNRELHILNEEFLQKINDLTSANTDLDQLVRGIDLGVILLDREMRIRRFTPAAVTAFHLMDCDLGRPLEHLSCKFAHDRLLEDVQAVITEGKPLEREVWHRQGAMLLRILPHRPQREVIEGAVLTFVDVSGIKRTEAALRQSEQRYRDLAESSLDALFIFGAWRNAQEQLTGFTFVDLNTRGEQLLGVTREDILGRRLCDLLPVPEGDVLERYRHVLETGQPLLEDFPCRDALGRTVWLQHQVNRFLDGIAITTRDITERKLAEAAVREGEQRLHGILENTPAAVYLKDLQGRYLLANRRFNELFGLAVETGQTFNDADFLPPTLEAPQFRHNDQQVLASGDTLECEESLTHLEPPSVHLTVRFPVRDAAGHVYAVAGIMTDITARKSIEQLLGDRAAQLSLANHVLESQNRELDDFTYMASHDLQEPLRTLRIYSDLLTADLEGHLPDQAAQDLEFITGAARQMQRLIDDLLSLSRTSRADMQPRRFPLRRCVNQAATNLSARLKQAGAQLAVGELPDVCGDETLLVQLFQNLIGNAVKFRDPARTPVVQVSAERKDNSWWFQVKDNGIGIKPEHFEKIFAPFQRLHSREEHEGSGIGLAICRKVVERHKGRLWAESVPGEGSTFRFTLNVTEAVSS